MAWPIVLTPARSAAVLEVSKRYLDHHRDDPAGQIFAIIYSQMVRSIQLGDEEQELLRIALLSEANSMTEPWEEFEIAVFQLYGVWCIEPPYWLEEMQRKYPDSKDR